MRRYVAMQRKGGPLHALDETSPAHGKSANRKPGRRPKAESPEPQVGNQPKKIVLRGR